jgi:hypothetical protein
VCVCDTASTHNLLPDTPAASLRELKQSAERSKDRKAPQTTRMLGQDATPNRLALILTPLSDDHSRVEPPLPIPNRTVKRSRANDSRHPPVKVGHRQTPYAYPKIQNLRVQKKPPPKMRGFFIARFLNILNQIENTCSLDSIA